MAVTYKKFFELLIDRDLKKQDRAEKAKSSPATISKMVADENVTMEVVEKVCCVLECTVDDISEFID